MRGDTPLSMFQRFIGKQYAVVNDNGGEPVNKQTLYVNCTIFI